MPELEEILDRVTEDVLGTMFFSAVLGVGQAPVAEDSLTALVEFSGSIRGVLGISSDQSTAMSHTASFLGMDTSEAPVEEAPAVVGELANVICGAMLPHLSPSGQFRIAPPRIFTGVDAARRIDEMPVLRRFELPEGVLSVGLSLGDEARA